MCASRWVASASHRSGPPPPKQLLRGQPLKAEAFAEAGEKAKEAVDPVSDFRGSAAYKKDMAAVFVRRALEKALADIRQQAKAKAAPKPAEEEGREKER